MSWTLLQHPEAKDWLDKIDDEIEERIKNKLRDKKKDPFHYLEGFQGRNLYKLRLGDYRALIDVERDNKVLKIQVIGHRSKIYKNL